MFNMHALHRFSCLFMDFYKRYMSNRNVNKDNDYVFKTYLKLLLSLNLILVHKIVLTEDKLTVLCYIMSILISIEMSANTVIFTVSAHIITIFYCLLKLF